MYSYFELVPSRQLKVQRDILTQIPYFAKAFSSNAFSESVELTFNLPDDDPSAVAEVLWFVLVGSVPPIMTDESSDSTCVTATVKVQSYVKAYIAADKLMVDDVKRKILEMVVVYHQDSHVDPDLVAVLSEADYHESALYAFLVAQLAWDFTQARTKYRRSGAQCELVTSFQKHVEESNMTRTDLCRLLLAMHVMRRCEDPTWSGFWLSGPEIEKHEDILKVSLQELATESLRRRA
ncbi:hypothetical protein LTR70_005509 [Exophiala xenobiotica]|uniref:BTB domain-containing protein n=1 Tax=Lithohypha guttulata TaxID=1690604 RepID=A0ABR0KDT0_9EURO|nr:hypothetical protein LTR24_003876 [Lithohypha guttulata]KAK5318366.1 hypothetical protein LTR70_005509 [Exophiala xenobiotica]